MLDDVKLLHKALRDSWDDGNITNDELERIVGILRGRSIPLTAGVIANELESDLALERRMLECQRMS